jgi:hypothetical protein
MLFLLYLGSRYRHRLRPGDLLFVFFIWYGVVRFALETLRSGNWTFFGVPTAQLVSVAFVAVGIVGLIVRHRSGRPTEAMGGRATQPATSTPATGTPGGGPEPPPPEGPLPTQPTRARRTQEADRGT